MNFQYCSMHEKEVSDTDKNLCRLDKMPKLFINGSSCFVEREKIHIGKIEKTQKPGDFGQEYTI